MANPSIVAHAFLVSEISAFIRFPRSQRSFGHFRDLSVHTDNPRSQRSYGQRDLSVHTDRRSFRDHSVHPDRQTDLGHGVDLASDPDQRRTDGHG